MLGADWTKQGPSEQYQSCLYLIGSSSSRCTVSFEWCGLTLYVFMWCKQVRSISEQSCSTSVGSTLKVRQKSFTAGLTGVRRLEEFDSNFSVVLRAIMIWLTASLVQTVCRLHHHSIKSLFKCLMPRFPLYEVNKLSFLSLATLWNTRYVSTSILIDSELTVRYSTPWKRATNRQGRGGQ